MPITDKLILNAFKRPDDIALAETVMEDAPEAGKGLRKWRGSEQVVRGRAGRTVTWRIFNEHANQFAHMLLEAGVSRGAKVAVLMANSLDLPPIYMGVLKSGAILVPLDASCARDDIPACLNLAGAEALVFGPEFSEAVDSMADMLPEVSFLVFVGDNCPEYARSHDASIGHFASEEPAIPIDENDVAVFSFEARPQHGLKAVLYNHGSISRASMANGCSAAAVESVGSPQGTRLFRDESSMCWMSGLMTGLPSEIAYSRT